MKRIICLIGLAAFLFALLGCGQAAPAPKDAARQNVQTAAEKPPQERASDTAAKTKKQAMKIAVKSADFTVVYELNSSPAAKALAAQLPLTLKVEPFSNNEIIFYPPKKLPTDDTPKSGGQPGSLSYYSPWGDVVMFYAPCSPNGDLYEIGRAADGQKYIQRLQGTVTVSALK